jgi:ATP-dependent Clp protease protease subunit
MIARGGSCSAAGLGAGGSGSGSSSSSTSGRALAGPSSSSSSSSAGVRRPTPLLSSSAGCSSRHQRTRTRSWRTWGPSADHSDGDADFYRLTSQLTDQYGLFKPTDQEQDDASLLLPDEQTGDFVRAPRAARLDETARPRRSNVLEDRPGDDDQGADAPHRRRRRPEWGLSPREIDALGLAAPSAHVRAVDPASLSSRAYMRGSTGFASASDPAARLGFSAATAASASSPAYALPASAASAAAATMAGRAPRSSGGARAALGDYQRYPEGRPIFLPEAERFGDPPDLPSLLLQQRVIYISMPFVPSVTELVVAQCYYLDFDDKNRQRPIYVYLNSTGCINDRGQALSADNEFYAIWAALGFTRAPLYTGVTWKAQNQAAVLLAAGQRGHRYTFPHAKISTAPPVMNRVFGQAVDAQLQSAELTYAQKYYAAILARATGKDLAACQKEYLDRKRYFSVKQAYEAGLVDKLVPGYRLNRFRKMARDAAGEGGKKGGAGRGGKPTFRFARQEGGGGRGGGPERPPAGDGPPAAGAV